MNIQFILNPYTCIMYCLSYISKPEHEMSDFLKSVIREMSPDTTSEREEMKQIMQAYPKNREVSAQEAVARTCSLKLKSCTRYVTFIQTGDDGLKMSLPVRYLQNMTPDAVNIWVSGLPEKYRARPETPEFENMCLAEFASTCVIVYGKQINRKNVVPLLNDMDYLESVQEGQLLSDILVFPNKKIQKGFVAHY